MCVLATVIRVIVSGQLKMMSTGGMMSTVTAVITIGFPLLPQKQGAVNQQGQ